MENIRVIELPKMKMVSSGELEIGDDIFTKFDKWLSRYDEVRVPKLFSYDFMYYNSASGKFTWLYAVYDDIKECPYDIVDFEGGIYAVATSIDEDEESGNDTYVMINDWVSKSEKFDLDSSRHTLFHVISSDKIYEKMKFRQLDVFVPIK